MSPQALLLSPTTKTGVQAPKRSFSKNSEGSGGSQIVPTPGGPQWDQQSGESTADIHHGHFHRDIPGQGQLLSDSAATKARWQGRDRAGASRGPPKSPRSHPGTKPCGRGAASVGVMAASYASLAVMAAPYASVGVMAAPYALIGVMAAPSASLAVMAEAGSGSRCHVTRPGPREGGGNAR